MCTFFKMCTIVVPSADKVIIALSQKIIIIIIVVVSRDKVFRIQDVEPAFLSKLTSAEVAFSSSLVVCYVYKHYFITFFSFCFKSLVFWLEYGMLLAIKDGSWGSLKWPLEERKSFFFLFLFSLKEIKILSSMPLSLKSPKKKSLSNCINLFKKRFFLRSFLFWQIFFFFLDFIFICTFGKRARLSFFFLWTSVFAKKMGSACNCISFSFFMFDEDITIIVDVFLHRRICWKRTEVEIRERSRRKVGEQLR